MWQLGSGTSNGQKRSLVGIIARFGLGVYESDKPTAVAKTACLFAADQAAAGCDYFGDGSRN